MKRCIALLLCLALALLAGCGRIVEMPETPLVIYASFYPMYVLALGVTDGAPMLELRCLTQPQDGCLRDYQLSDWDVALLSDADAVLLGGRGLESFESALTSSALPTAVLMSGLALDGEGTEAPAGDDEASHLVGANPWAFLGVDGAEAITEAAAAALITFDPGNADIYRKNAETRAAAFTSLRAAMAASVADVSDQPVALFHEGLVYLADALGLTVGARIDRESAAEMDDTALASALEAVKAGGAAVVLIEMQAPDRLVCALEAAGLFVARIDTLTAHTGGTAADYERIMRANAEAVAAALRAAGGVTSEAEADPSQSGS